MLKKFISRFPNTNFIFGNLFGGFYRQLHHEVEIQLRERGEEVCGTGKVQRLFDIETKTKGDFKMDISEDAIFSINYPQMIASAKVECK
jgi:hypothetical protein